MFLVLPLVLMSSVSPAPPPPPLSPPRPNMTGAGAGCAGPVQSYPASWPNSHYYQGGGTSRYLFSIYYHKIKDNFSINNDKYVRIYLVWCPLAAVHDQPGPRRGHGRDRPGLRAAADRLHPGQHDGGHGGGVYNMLYNVLELETRAFSFV